MKWWIKCLKSHLNIFFLFLKGVFDIGHEHNADNMDMNLRMILKEFNIYGKCRAMVTDNASVMKSLAEKLSIHHVGKLLNFFFFLAIIVILLLIRFFYN
jgi:hypothetical protein